MAVEIRELVIKAVIVDDENDEPAQTRADASSVDKEEIIQECVNQVLKIIKKNNNR